VSKDRFPLQELVPSNYWHAQGLAEALAASTEWLQMCAGASFVAGDDEIAKGLREMATQLWQHAKRIEATIISFPRPDDTSMLDTLNQPPPPKRRRRRR
jgi:hypothetical protein